VAEESRASQIERAIREVAGLDVMVEETDGTITLEGMVDSERDRQAAEDIAADLAGDADIDNALEVEDLLPVSVEAFASEERSAEVLEGLPEGGGAEIELNPDFTDQSLVRDPFSISGPRDGADDDEGADDGDRVYIPPTDPVSSTDARGEAVVLGGFGISATDDVGTDVLVDDHGYGDEAIADAVRRELREDAATTDLRVRVVVRDGVVHLHGAVPDLNDADAAEEVASRVTGVREIREELDVEADGPFR
jgi:osmotically-inducible protein OsmY